MNSQEICVAGEDREFKVQLRDKPVGVDDAVAKESWCIGQWAWEEPKFSTRLPVRSPV